MDVTGFASVEVVAGLIAGSLATVGAIVALGLVASAVHGGVATAGRLVTGRLCGAQVDGRTARVDGTPTPGSSFSPVSSRSLFARQAWWRIQC